jgi:hypothetical protein
MVGGVVTSFIGELIVYPSIYFIWRSIRLKRTPLLAHASDDYGVHNQPPTQ